MTPKINIKLFKQSYNIQVKLAQCLIPQIVNKKDLVKASMIFAVKPSNSQEIPKFISLLGKMYVIICLPI